MPDPTRILEGLATVAAGQAVLAIVWHAVLAVVILAILAGWRPSRKVGATALAAPLLSVGVLAWRYGNPFNATVFLVFAAGLAVLGMRQPAGPTQKAPTWAALAGVLMIGFGWVYPHFLAGASWWEYLYQAPTGLIPCPTLSAAIGFALLADGFSSRAWSRWLGILGLFYGLFGAFRLGVKMDLVLVAGAVALLGLTGTSGARSRRAAQRNERAARRAA